VNGAAPSLPSGQSGTSVDQHRPPAEVHIDRSLVEGLLADQHPDLVGLPLRPVAGGWDNELWRLGEDLAVRLPRGAAAAAVVRQEHRWLPHVAGLVPVAVPTPVRVGRPAGAYPWHWSVVPWLTGTVAAAEPVHLRTRWAGALGRTVAALHVPAPEDAPVNDWGRGGPLGDRDDVVRDRLVRLADGPLGGRAVDRLLALWEEAVAAPAWSGPRLWLHGDLHPANLLADDGRLVALLDLGDLTAGDPATDLATAWMTFDADGHAAFAATARVAQGPDEDALWCRARGWAVAMASGMLGVAADDPVIGSVARHTVDRLLPAT
jgi:aminoglycoside phosphotransferase (APT) family kinase protein